MMGDILFGFQAAFPFRLFKAHKNHAIPDGKRPLHQHSVGCKQFQHFFFAHGRQPVFQIHGLIEQAAGVEKLFQRQAAGMVPRREFLVRRVVCFDVPDRIVNSVFVQLLLRLLAGSALGVANKVNHSVTLLTNSG